MFQQCNKIEYLDLSNFNTSKVEDLSFIFNQCQKLKEIKGINNFNTSQVKNMSCMFQECNELESLDLSNFDTSKVDDINNIFFSCYKLKEIKGINNFNTNHKCLQLKYYSYFTSSYFHPSVPMKVISWKS